MDFTSVHTGFVLAAYGVSVVMLTALVMCVLLRDHSLHEQIRRREDQP